MKAFLERLDGELSLLASTPTSGEAHLRPRPSRPRRTALTLAATATVVVALGTLPWVAERTERLSPLDAPIANAAAHAGRPGIPSPASYDLGRSRSFPTPDGPGFVVNSTDGKRRCLVLPDRLIPDSFGSSCKAVATLRQQGNLVEMVQGRTDRQAGRTLAAFLLPRGASPDVRVVTGGRETAVAVTNGVAVVVVSDEATLRYRVDGYLRTAQIPAPFEDTGKGAYRCPDGRLVHFDLPPRPPSGSAPPPLRAVRYCD